MALVNAKCTSCGSPLTVDNDRGVATCEFCGSSYVVENAILNYNNTININNATVNVIGSNIENLLARAKTFENNGDISKAKEYYNRILDIDINNYDANESLARILNAEKKKFKCPVCGYESINIVDRCPICGISGTKFKKIF